MSSKKQFLLPPLLADLLLARSPSGVEFEAQGVLDKHIQPQSEVYEKDSMGNRLATLNNKGNPSLMLAGHMDELGLMVLHIDQHGFIYFDTIGGHDAIILSGRRVHILSKKGIVPGVTGKRAVHLLNKEERTKVPEKHEIWIDIGVSSKEEALQYVNIGDSIVYADGIQTLHENRLTARALDNKCGCYVINEAFLRLAKTQDQLKAKVVAASTTQEEIGIRGAITAAYKAQPNVALAVDVSHATDHPDCDNRRFGETFLGKGPIIVQGPNINPKVHERLVQCAKALNMPYQLEADPRPTGTDARALQVSRGGVATGLVAIPLRYMHTPSEMIDLQDLEHAVQLVVAFAQSLSKQDDFHY